MGICDGRSKKEKILVNPKGEKFFNVLSDRPIPNQNNKDVKKIIKLEVSINQINRNCQYNIKLYNKIGNKNYLLNEVDKCSILDYLTAKLNSPILIEYCFEKQQLY